MPAFIKKLDDSFQHTRLGKYFELEERGSKLSIEFTGAMATFMSTAYILAVNPRILAVRTTT
jgi:AGZA family xanthine/uracil permease-like MFS transporter